MQTLTVMGLFCEDIREERDGIVSLVGIFPDNVDNIEVTGGDHGSVKLERDMKMLSKLCMYVRVNFDPDYDLPEPKMRLIQPNGEHVDLGIIEMPIVSKARTDAKAKGNILAGVVARISIGGFRAPKSGLLQLQVILGDEAHLAGALNFRFKASKSSSEPPQPS